MSMSRIATMEESMVDNEGSNDEMDIEEEPQFSAVSSSEHSHSSGPESGTDLSDSEISSDDEKPQPIK